MFPPIEDLLLWLAIFGTAVFAISGALAGLRQQLDIVGVTFVATLTGVGGGTLRDVLLGATPVGWVTDPLDIFICIGCAIAVCLLNKKLLGSRLQWLYLADALGLAVFAIIGAAKAQAVGAHPFACILFGAMSASFGGILRDVICNETPVFLQREIYITAALVGAALYMFLPDFIGFGLRASAGMVVAFAMRWLAITHNWSLPFPRYEK